MKLSANGKAAIIFGVGAGVGAVIGSVVTYIVAVKKKYAELDKKIEECNMELETVRSEKENLQKDLDVAHEKLFEEHVRKRENSDYSITLEEYAKLYHANGDSFDGIDATRRVDPAETEHPEEDPVGEDIEEENYIPDAAGNLEGDLEEADAAEDDGLVDPEEELSRFVNEMARQKRPPKLITFEAFDNEYRGVYEKETLYYYVYDDVLATEDEEEVTDVASLVGDALDKFGFRDNNEEVIYVRNFVLMTDYEIIKAWAEFGNL